MSEQKMTEELRLSRANAIRAIWALDSEHFGTEKGSGEVYADWCARNKLCSDPMELPETYCGEIPLKYLPPGWTEVMVAAGIHPSEIVEAIPELNPKMFPEDLCDVYEVRPPGTGEPREARLERWLAAYVRYAEHDRSWMKWISEPREFDEIQEEGRRRFPGVRLARGIVEASRREMMEAGEFPAHVPVPVEVLKKLTDLEAACWDELRNRDDERTYEGFLDSLLEILGKEESDAVDEG